MYQKKESSLLKHFDFMLLDLLIMGFSFGLSFLVWNHLNGVLFQQQYLLMLSVLILIQIMVVIFQQNYKDILRRGYVTELKNVFMQNTIVMALAFTFMFIVKLQPLVSRMIFIQVWAYNVCFMYVARLIWKRFVRKRLRNSDERSHLIVISMYENAETCLQQLREKLYQPYRISGVIIYDRPMQGMQIDGIPVVSNRDEIFEYTRKQVVDEVLLNIPPDEHLRKVMVERFLEMGVTVHINLDWDRTELPNSYMQTLGECSVITTSMKMATPYQLFVKRFLDIIGSIMGLTFTGILFIIFSPIIYIQSPGPVFFSQERVGRNGRRFRIYKFRSMYMDAEERKKELMDQNQMSGLMFKMENDPRIIPIGRFMRKYSIDEFPQFWNVLKGEMSLVGTRPPTVDEFEQYAPHHKARLSIKPGLTGLWQVSGRSNITDFEEVVRLDNQYIREWNLRLDLKLLCKTVGVVLASRGSF